MKRTHLMLMALIFWAITPVAPGVQADFRDTFGALDGELTISGGTAHIPVMKALATQVMKASPQVRISIAGGGSGLGIKQVGEGIVAIGNSGRSPKKEEIDRYGLVLHRWAVDGVAIAVHPDNPVRALSFSQLRAVYAGTLSNWKELGGPDRTINLYTRDASSGTRSVFWKKALSKGEIHAKANFVKSNGAMKSALAGDPYGIGYLSVGHLDASVAGLAIEGVSPTLENVKSGTYIIARGLYSNTKGEATGLARAFLDALYSPEGQKIIAAKGFIPVKG
ncbi:phosphate ABC transporter substrate-binding protein [Desulfoluna limicola]|uniref:Phosphate ABC transporter substrate-binding protein n=1 Tax=Desulfoluna limicola TaxID=2810562 RepID=A0ABM7PJ34_9BACT|nr:phosphate ABC transporter substrate-binding protein [Desulfoluna limicola]BCS97299.1 phosphate ABC transporter substrate-binding protein [Desulfoluna limicola]